MAAVRWLVALSILSGFLFAPPTFAADGVQGNLVNVQWLTQNVGREDVLLLDASPPPQFAKGHIPGAINVDLFSYGANEIPVAEMERRLQAWGVSPNKKIVLYDQGGSMMATRVFFDLYYYGFPATKLYVLDGGFAKWQQAGGTTTKDPSPTPARGSFRISRINEDVRIRLPQFLAASSDSANHALVEALEPTYHFGESKFFDRGGHIPNGIMLPTADFFNADKTFKSADEIRRMLTYFGIRPEQQIHSYCGGGIAASVPFFAAKFIAGYPKVTLYKESQLEWLRDDRGLPFWTYDAPYLTRDKNWVNGWSNRMLRSFGVSNLSIIDVRSAEAYQQGHIPFALHVPADVFRRHARDSAPLPSLLGSAGVNAADEAVIVSSGGVNPSAALAFAVLERIGQRKVSILMESMDDWGLHGYTLTTEPTLVGARRTPQDIVVPAVPYAAAARAGVVVTDAAHTKGEYPKIFIASGKAPPASPPDGRVIHVPYTTLLNDDGSPKAAKDIWNALAKAGVPRYAEIICLSDDPGEAAVNYFILKLMGFPDVKILL